MNGKEFHLSRFLNFNRVRYEPKDESNIETYCGLRQSQA